jgi:very-short-patch-repair endonuclease
MVKKHDMKTLEWRVKQYSTNMRSIGNIAAEIGVPKSTLRRQLIKDGINLRTKSQAQKVALDEGRSEHPTEGKPMPEETKVKISEAVSKLFQELSEDEKKARSDAAKQQWNKLSADQKRELLALAREASREAAKTGSKLEKFLREGLTKANYLVKYHVEGLIPREKLQIDIYLPEMRTVVEVDGPSHFEPIWGIENLRRNQRSDAHKTGLLIERDFVIIRIKQLQKSLSKKMMRDILDKLVETLEQIKKKRPSDKRRLIELEVE